MPRSLLSVHVQPDFLLAVRNGHIPLRRSKDDRLPRSRGAELFGEIYLDGQYGPLDGHLHVLHDRWPFSDGRSVNTPSPNNGATCTVGRGGSQSTEARESLVSLVYLVCLVCLVELDKRDRPEEPDQPLPVTLQQTPDENRP